MSKVDVSTVMIYLFGFYSVVMSSVLGEPRIFIVTLIFCMLTYGAINIGAAIHRERTIEKLKKSIL